MNIYLLDEGSEWQLHSGTLNELKTELDKRNIVIGKCAEIGNYAEIGDYADIGYSAKIGDYAKIGYSAKIGYYAKIGKCAEIGDYAKIGYSAKIGDYAKIGKCAEIGDYANIGKCAEIGDYANIGDSAKIGNYNFFSRTGIFINTSVLMESETEGIFYKAVTPNLTDFHSGSHQYEVGKGSKINGLKKDQSVYCGVGFHFTSLWGAVRFLDGRDGVIISAKVKLDDILSVHNKIRTKAYSDVQIVDLPIYNLKPNITNRRGSLGR